MTEMSEFETAETVYAAVEDKIFEPCMVKTLWSNRRDAEKYAAEKGLRIVRWSVLRKKRLTQLGWKPKGE